MKHGPPRSKPERPAAPERSTQGVSPLDAQIDENLRLIYRHCVEEGIPESMRALVDRLGDQLARHRTGAGNSRGADDSSAGPSPRHPSGGS